jgi:hypothetical protein
MTNSNYHFAIRNSRFEIITLSPMLMLYAKRKKRDNPALIIKVSS